ncbi:hypothetical protein BpHYR1_043861 [Brachionus plicatilis]|uniref:Uncharacterized protein n=1 Tax=Brachionus plicatilis TaxID=10195 RepID=A0A3M7SA39_BRAPC|nr:hypothetical protein BpHYR1_043861 [Brachionus plicatilis]
MNSIQQNILKFNRPSIKPFVRLTLKNKDLQYDDFTANHEFLSSNFFTLIIEIIIIKQYFT